MAQWLQLEQVGQVQDLVCKLYDETFPMEIRKYLSGWIESKDWDKAANDVSLANDLFNELLHQLEEQQHIFSMEKNILQQHNFRRIKQNLSYRFDDPMTLAKIIRQRLKDEKDILTSALNRQDGTLNDPETEKKKEFDHHVKNMRNIIWELDQSIKSLEDRYEDLDYRMRALQSRGSAVQAKQLNGLAQLPAVQDASLIINCQRLALNQIREEVPTRIDGLLNLAHQNVQTLLSVELPEWRRRQQLACIGGPDSSYLEHLQMWFTAVAEGLQQLHLQLKRLEEQEEKYNPDGANAKLSWAMFEQRRLVLLKNLLVNALVVERQPRMVRNAERPLILKIGNRFEARIRYLVKLPELNYHMRVRPVFDKDVNERNSIKGFRKFAFEGEKRNGGISKVLAVEDCNGTLAAEFGHLELKQIGNRLKENLTVTEELHIITFETELRLPGLEVNIETSSLPLVVVTSSSQTPSAWASIMWYNMMTDQLKDLSFFLNPPPATWQQLSEVLSWQFSSISQQGLDADQLAMLKDKLFGEETNNPEEPVSWAKFSQGRFWAWINKNLSLIQKFLLPFWNDELLMGFVSRKRSEALLRGKPTGTFLLRFSETSKEGAIAVSWVEHGDKGTIIHHVQPHTRDELSNDTLPELLNKYVGDCPGNTENPLQYLYPDIPREEAFIGYHSSPVTKSKISGYGYEYRIRLSMILVMNKQPSAGDEVTSAPQKSVCMDVPEQMDVLLSSNNENSNSDFPCSDEPCQPSHPFMAVDLYSDLNLVDHEGMMLFDVADAAF